MENEKSDGCAAAVLLGGQHQNDSNEVKVMMAQRSALLARIENKMK